LTRRTVVIESSFGVSLSGCRGHRWPVGGAGGAPGGCMQGREGLAGVLHRAGSEGGRSLVRQIGRLLLPGLRPDPAPLASGPGARQVGKASRPGPPAQPAAPQPQTTRLVRQSRNPPGVQPDPVHASWAPVSRSPYRSRSASATPGR
jgi:hypothetical protein